MNVKKNLRESGILVPSEKIQYLCTMVCGEELRKFDTLSDEVGSATSEHLNSIIFGLVIYFFPDNALSKLKTVMCRGMMKNRGLKLRRYTDRMIDLNEYLSVLHGAKLSDEIFETELNRILLNSMPNIWIRQACVQVFDCETITFIYL